MILLFLFLFFNIYFSAVEVYYESARLLRFFLYDINDGSGSFCGGIQRSGEERYILRFHKFVFSEEIMSKKTLLMCYNCEKTMLMI